LTTQFFLEALTAVDLQNVFNPYRQVCCFYDDPASPGIRLKNLEICLNAAASANADVWIGRDLGYRGGRRTGLALVDEAHFSCFEKTLGVAKLQRATKGPVLWERTASIIADIMVRVQRPVFTWNAFPFHPHEPDNPMSNRQHTKAEALIGAELLKELVELVKPSQLVAIGNDAATSLREMGIDAHEVRHPSYGGVNEFIAGIERIYGLNSRANNDTQLSLFS
jgi:uracil-DNA glycosylase